MKKLMASVAAIAFVAGPALAAPATATTKADAAKATTTVTTKVTPASAKGKKHAMAKRHRRVHHMKMHKTVAKKATDTTKS